MAVITFDFLLWESRKWFQANKYLIQRISPKAQDGSLESEITYFKCESFDIKLSSPEENIIVW